MPVCPKCRNEYLEGVVECPDCGVALVDRLDRPENVEAVEIYACASRLEAEHLKAILDDGGVRCRLRIIESSSFPTDGGAMSDVHLVIDERDYKAARAIIQKALDNKEISDKGLFLGSIRTTTEL